MSRPLYGIAPVPAGSAMIMSPTVARVLLDGLDLAVVDARRNGAPLPAELVDAIRDALGGVGELAPPAPSGSAEVPILDTSGSEPRSWRCVRAVALELGVSDRYVRRVAGVELEGMGYARRRPDGSWEIDERGVEFMRARRRTAP